MKMDAVIDVDVEPVTAFEVFVGEIDQWWGNGPIDARVQVAITVAGTRSGGVCGGRRCHLNAAVAGPRR